ncbi:MAG TPA: uracil-DNA glycosylase family protein [Verrucomicrobiae bacterium]|nr:uracil-DNA glycosylase family protein [Verrucomicrobiae bacterium]
MEPPQPVDDREELKQMAAALRRHLTAKARAGIRVIPKDRPRESNPVAPALSESSLLITGDPAVYESKTLDELRAAIGDCRRCKLWSGRTHLVFGVGNPSARVMFVGEGPGRDEDLQGVPFVGRAGQLLTDIITKGMGLKREDVYIANVVKCRPPENRNPEPDEVESCEPFLKKQVDLVRPKIIVALGKFAVQCLLQSKQPITRLRGQWHEYQGIKLMPTFHPAYLLRNPGDKKLVWEDIKKVIEALKSA